MKTKMVWLLSVACWLGIDLSLGEMLLRVADYNIKFLSVEDLDAKPQRKQRLKTVIEQLKPDILALQEIKDRQALEQLFDSDEWSILIDDDSNDAQDLAIVVRRPLTFKDRQTSMPTMQISFSPVRHLKTCSAIDATCW
jgi:endonuclease/exonuclease/phosphatase family metal-dependent hydrolase